MSKFVDYQVLTSFCESNPEATAKQMLEYAAEFVNTIVCGVGNDDIDEVYDTNEDDGDMALTDEQRIEILQLFARRFDWSACHTDLIEAIETVRSGEYLGSGEDYV